MFHWTFGGRPVYSAPAEADNLARLGLPTPPDFGRANSLLNVLGRECARGWLLLRSSDLPGLNLDALHDLVASDGVKTVAARNLVVAREPLHLTRAITPFIPDGCYLVEVADARWRVQNPFYSVPANKSYNVRANAWGGAADSTIYHADSLNAGSPWTWLTLVQDLWGLMATQLGAAPTSLPFTPDGTPEGWTFPGVPAWGALCDVLDRIGCAVRWDPSKSAGAYSIVRVGATDAATEAQLAAAEALHLRVHDAEYRTVVRGKVPAAVRVWFHRLEQYGGTEETASRVAGRQWQTNAVYFVDIATGYANAEAGTVAEVWDDLPAIYDPTGALTNGAALNTRAAERAADYLRMLTGVGGGRLHKTYAGLLPFAPGSEIRGVAWRQDHGNGGALTEVVRRPERLLRVTDKGEWAEAPCCGSTAIQPPAFGPTWPVAAGRMEVVRIQGLGTVSLAEGTLAGSVFGCTLEKGQVSGAGVGDLAARDPVWGVDLAAAQTLAAGQSYLARLVGYRTVGGDGRPLYAFRSTAGALGACDPVPITTQTVRCEPTGLNVYQETDWLWWSNGCLSKIPGTPTLIYDLNACLPPPPPPNTTVINVYKTESCSVDGVSTATLTGPALFISLCNGMQWFWDGEKWSWEWCPCGEMSGSGSGSGSGGCVPGACSSCHDAPYLRSFTGSGFEGALAAFNGAWELAPVSGSDCVWQQAQTYQGLSAVATLVRSGGTETLTLTYADGAAVLGQSVYSAAAAGTDCCSPVTLASVSCNDYTQTGDGSGTGSAPACPACSVTNSDTPNSWSVTIGGATGCYGGFNGTWTLDPNGPCTWGASIPGGTLLWHVAPRSGITQASCSLNGALAGATTIFQHDGLEGSDCCQPVTCTFLNSTCVGYGTMPGTVTVVPSCGGPPAALCPPSLEIDSLCCFDHPSGSGPGSGSGSGPGSGGTVSTSCCATTPVTLHATVTADTNASSLAGSVVTLTYDAVSTFWKGTAGNLTVWVKCALLLGVPTWQMGAACQGTPTQWTAPAATGPGDSDCNPVHRTFGSVPLEGTTACRDNPSNPAAIYVTLSQ